MDAILQPGKIIFDGTPKDPAGLQRDLRKKQYALHEHLYTSSIDALAKTSGRNKEFGLAYGPRRISALMTQGAGSRATDLFSHLFEDLVIFPHEGVDPI